MRKAVFASVAARLALAGMGLAVAAGPVVAQEVQEVTVIAPLSVRQPVGRTSSGGTVDLITVTHRVGYADLDLTRSADAAALRARVDETAKVACKQLKTLYPLVPADPDCVKAALKDAMAQADAAIAAAGGGK